MRLLQLLPDKAIRLFASLITMIGMVLLVLLFIDWHKGILPAKYFPNSIHGSEHHIYSLLLGLPVPLHVIFIGLILQKKWLSPPMARCAWAGIVFSGCWLGAALIVRLL